VTFDGVWVFRGTAGMPVGSNPPNVLKPGESATVVVGPANFSYRWSTEVWARPYGLRDRIAAKVATLPGGMMQKLRSKLAAPRNGVPFKLNTVTNRPPAQPRRHRGLAQKAIDSAAGRGNVPHGRVQEKMAHCGGGGRARGGTGVGVVWACRENGGAIGIRRIHELLRKLYQRSLQAAGSNPQCVQRDRYGYEQR